MFRQQKESPESAPPTVESSAPKAWKAYEDALSTFTDINKEISAFIETDTVNSYPETIQGVRTEKERLESLYNEALENLKKVGQDLLNLKNKQQ